MAPLSSLHIADDRAMFPGPGTGYVLMDSNNWELRVFYTIAGIIM
jgi:hypothetical protein